MKFKFEARLASVFLASLVFTFSACAQNLQGRWAVSQLVADEKLVYLSTVSRVPKKPSAQFKNGAFGFYQGCNAVWGEFLMEQAGKVKFRNRIERGRYLAHHVSQCVDCHSTRDWSRFSAPNLPGTEGKGGELFDRKLGFPGAYYAPNITPFHLKDWSDGELFRAITAGVSKDGRALFPIMPYPNFGKMDKEDVYSIIAYIRTLPSVENQTPAPESDFPMNIIIHTIPRKGEFTQRPAVSDRVNYGKYLTNAASCVECHTQMQRGELVEGMEFAGGRFFPLTGGGTVVSANITPDRETGIGNWTEETFVQRFKAFDKSAVQGTDAVKPGEFNTIMPWQKYAGMTVEDLAAVYAYLKTLKPVNNRVEKVFLKK